MVWIFIIFCIGMICDTEMGASVQLMNIIRTLLDPENMLASVNKSGILLLVPYRLNPSWTLRTC